MTQQEKEPIGLEEQAEKDWKEQASVAKIEEYERWKAELDKEYELELRRDEYERDTHWDGMDITLLDRKADEGELLDSSKALRISTDEDYFDLIYGNRPEDLHEMVTGEALSAAIRRLTRCQKEALFCRMQPYTKTKETAEDLGSSTRNIRKTLARAKKNIIEQIGDPR